jgi:hypothetical protein
MQVNGDNIIGTQPSQIGRPTESQGVERSAQTRLDHAASGGDRVELSGLVVEIGRAEAALSAQRSQRVQELAALYKSGRYVPDAGETSRQMVTELLANSSVVVGKR